MGLKPGISGETRSFPCAHLDLVRTKLYSGYIDQRATEHNRQQPSQKCVRKR